MIALRTLGALALALALPAGGAAAETSTQKHLAGTILGPAFDLSRIQCMDGTAVQTETEMRQESPNREPGNTGEYCLGLMAHSADAERDATALQERPDKALLAPYAELAERKGFRGTDANAATALAALARVAQHPDAQGTIGPGQVPLAGGNGKPLVIVPGVALDVGFTSTIRSTARQPAPIRSRAEIIAVAGKCVTNTQETIGACYRVGVEFARLYLSSRSSATIH